MLRAKRAYASSGQPSAWSDVQHNRRNSKRGGEAPTAAPLCRGSEAREALRRCGGGGAGRRMLAGWWATCPHSRVHIHGKRGRAGG